jgi:hypothetical protein
VVTSARWLASGSEAASYKQLEDEAEERIRWRSKSEKTTMKRPKKKKMRKEEEEELQREHSHHVRFESKVAGS